MTGARYEAIVIGGGFFGCSLALHLKTRADRVLVLEKESDLLCRASYANVARVHNGYHYPRSLLTALRSRANFPRFVAQYRECIVADAGHYYAVCRSSSMSKVTAVQFRTFCERIGVPVASAGGEIKRLFNQDLVEDVFSVTECVFDAVALRERVARDLSERGVEVRCNSRVVGIKAAGAGEMRVDFANGDWVEACAAKYVFNCTYSQVNQILAMAGAPGVALKHELAEIALVEVPDHLKHLGITIVDGPFLSVLPFPSRGVHSLTHVRYTPHQAWQDPEGSSRDPHEVLARVPRRTSFGHMIRDAQRYVPSLRESRYVESLWEVKTVLPRSEEDDSRPILFARDREAPNLISIVGGKIDNVYDMLAEIDAVVS